MISKRNLEISILNNWQRQRKSLPEQCQNLPWLPESGPLGLCLESQDLDIHKQLAGFHRLFPQHFRSHWAVCPHVCQGRIRSLKQAELLAETIQWLVSIVVWERRMGAPDQSGTWVPLILVSAAKLLLRKERQFISWEIQTNVLPRDRFTSRSFS